MQVAQQQRQSYSVTMAYAAQAQSPAYSRQPTHLSQSQTHYSNEDQTHQPPHLRHVSSTSSLSSLDSGTGSAAMHAHAAGASIVHSTRSAAPAKTWDGQYHQSPVHSHFDSSSQHRILDESAGQHFAPAGQPAYAQESQTPYAGAITASHQRMQTAGSDSFTSSSNERESPSGSNPGTSVNGRDNTSNGPHSKARELGSPLTWSPASGAHPDDSGYQSSHNQLGRAEMASTMDEDAEATIGRSGVNPTMLSGAFQDSTGGGIVVQTPSPRTTASSGAAWRPTMPFLQHADPSIVISPVQPLSNAPSPGGQTESQTQTLKVSRDSDLSPLSPLKQDGTVTPQVTLSPAFLEDSDMSNGSIDPRQVSHSASPHGSPDPQAAQHGQISPYQTTTYEPHSELGRESDNGASRDMLHPNHHSRSTATTSSSAPGQTYVGSARGYYREHHSSTISPNSPYSAEGEQEDHYAATAAEQERTSASAYHYPSHSASFSSSHGKENASTASHYLAAAHPQPYPHAHPHSHSAATQRSYSAHHYPSYYYAHSHYAHDYPLTATYPHLQQYPGPYSTYSVQPMMMRQDSNASAFSSSTSSLSATSTSRYESATPDTSGAACEPSSINNGGTGIGGPITPIRGTSPASAPPSTAENQASWYPMQGTSTPAWGWSLPTDEDVRMAALKIKEGDGGASGASTGIGTGSGPADDYDDNDASGETEFDEEGAADTGSSIQRNMRKRLSSTAPSRAPAPSTDSTSPADFEQRSFHPLASLRGRKAGRRPTLRSYGSSDGTRLVGLGISTGTASSRMSFYPPRSASTLMSSPYSRPAGISPFAHELGPMTPASPGARASTSGSRLGAPARVPRGASQLYSNAKASYPSPSLSDGAIYSAPSTSLAFPSLLGQPNIPPMPSPAPRTRASRSGAAKTPAAANGKEGASNMMYDNVELFDGPAASTRKSRKQSTPSSSAVVITTTTANQAELSMMPTKRSRGRRPVISPDLAIDESIDSTIAHTEAQIGFSGTTKTGRPKKIFVCRVPECNKCFKRSEWRMGSGNGIRSRSRALTCVFSHTLKPSTSSATCGRSTLMTNVRRGRSDAERQSLTDVCLRISQLLLIHCVLPG